MVSFDSSNNELPAQENIWAAQGFVLELLAHNFNIGWYGAVLFLEIMTPLMENIEHQYGVIQ